MRALWSVMAATLLVVLWLLRPTSVDRASGSYRSPVVATATPVPTPLPDLRAARSGPRAAALQASVSRAQAEAVLHGDLALHAVGSQLRTAWNTPVTLKTINWDGFEYAPFVPDGLDHRPLDTILASLRALGFNALRLMFADATVESNPVVTRGLDANPDLRGLHALDIMQRIIGRAGHYGIRVILCNSRSEGGRGPEIRTGLWYTKRYPESAWFADWEELAHRFRDESAFVGADLRNEPHITGGVFTEAAYFQHGPLWGAYHGVYYHDRDWHYAAQTLGNDLLAIDPHLLIIVEGVQIYLDPFRNVLTGGLWGSNLEGVQYDPIVLDRPGQLVYSVHEYGPQMWQGSWFNPHTTYVSLARRWDRLWGYLLSAQKLLRAPIFVGEFGTCHQYWACIASNEGWKQGFWFQSFVRYLSAHPAVSWAYWSLNPTGPFQAGQSNFYSLVSPDWRHYYPLIVHGLAPILREPDGLWQSRRPNLQWTPQPGCPLAGSCLRPVPGDSLLTTARPAAVRKIVVTRNVSYADWPDPARSGDIYQPRPSSGRRPAVILLHGGGWDGGSRAMPEVTRLATALAWHGYVVYAIDYRLEGHGGDYPDDIRDVKAAGAVLAANAPEWGLDPRRIAVAGIGTGGYLALMAAYTPNGPPFAPRTANPVVPFVAVGSYFAPVDLLGIGRIVTDAAALGAVSAYLHATYAQDTALYRTASPEAYDTHAVPTIFFGGAVDPDQPFAQIFHLYRVLKQSSITAQLIDLPGAPHALDDLSPTTRQKSVAQLTNFLDGVFYPSPRN